MQATPKESFDANNLKRGLIVAGNRRGDANQMEQRGDRASRRSINKSHLILVASILG
jgi:hypothetical protein